MIVTHELQEAILVSDRVIALSPHWDWKTRGIASYPGATVVYDKPSLVDLPDRDTRYDVLARQHREIRAAAFGLSILSAPSLSGNCGEREWSRC